MDWMVPRNRLDREQLAMLSEILDGDGNYFVKGCPGTGKSVLLAHIYRDYKATHPGARVCILTYTHALIACLKDGLRDSSAEVYTFPSFCYRHGYYDLILVDEAQDMEPKWASTISSAASRAILFGDFGQSIYDDRLDENDLMNSFSPKVLELKTIYRLTKSLKELVQAVYPGRVFNAQIGRLVADTDIQLLVEGDSTTEMEAVADRMRKFAKPQKPAAVLFSTKRRLLRFMHVVCPELPDSVELDDGLNDRLRSSGVVFRFLGNGFGSFSESDTRPIVYVMTWHSSKGLDFESVGLPDLSKARLDEDAPFYVAMTRARRNLLMSYNGVDRSGKMSLIGRCPVVKNASASSGGNTPVAGGPADDGDEIVF